LFPFVVWSLRTAFASKMIQMALTWRTLVEHCPSADLTGGDMAVTDADIRVPIEVRDRLARIAAAERLSLRAYLTRLSDAAMTPAERAERAARTRALLKAWNGYDPTEAEEAELDAELDRRIAQGRR
jgi:hypothetical protein